MNVQLEDQQQSKQDNIQTPGTKQGDVFGRPADIRAQRGWQRRWRTRNVCGRAARARQKPCAGIPYLHRRARAPSRSALGHRARHHRRNIPIHVPRIPRPHRGATGVLRKLAGAWPGASADEGKMAHRAVGLWPKKAGIAADHSTRPNPLRQSLRIPGTGTVSR